MSTDTISTLTIDENNLNDGTHYSVRSISRSWYGVPKKRVETQETIAGPKKPTIVRQGACQFAIHIDLLDSSYATRATYYKTLKQYCRSGEAETDTHTLSVTDSTYSANPLTQEIHVTEVVVINQDLTTVELICEAEDPRKYGAWAALINVTDEAVPYTNAAVANAGNCFAPAIICIDPQTFDGTKYYSDHWFWNNTTRQITNCPVMITYDQYTERAAGRSTDTGADICVWVNGNKKQRWLANAASAHTETDPIADDAHKNIKVWFYLNLPPKKSTTTTMAVANTDTVTEASPLTLTVTDANSFPASSNCKLTNEIFAYKKLSNTKLKLTKRALPGGSAAATHASGSELIVIPKHVRLQESATAAVQPTGDLEPAINLQASDNTGWAWNSPKIGGNYSEYSWGWKKGRVAYDNFFCYRKAEDPTGSWSPSTGERYLGICKAIATDTYDRNDAWLMETPFEISQVAGLDTHSQTDPAYCYGAISLKEQNKWCDIATWPEASTAGAWADTAISDITGLSGSREIAIRQVRVVGIQTRYAVDVRSIVLVFASADQVGVYPSTPSWSSNSKRVNVTINSSTTGEEITVEASYTGQTWTVADAKEGRCYWSNSDPPLESSGAIVQPLSYRVEIDENQVTWITLAPGNNAITISSDDTATAHIRLYYQPTYI